MYSRRKIRITLSKRTLRFLKRYEEMHELARHTIHSSEVLRVACKILLRMVADHERLCQENKDALSRTTSEESTGGRHDTRGRRHQKSLRQIANDLSYYAAVVDCLRQRSQSFDERLRNEVALVSCICHICE